MPTAEIRTRRNIVGADVPSSRRSRNAETAAAARLRARNRLSRRLNRQPSERTMQVSRTIRAPVTATPRIAIVGAGFTGALLAVHLLREARSPVVIHLFEQHGWFGRGVAYSTGNPSHLLNVRVANMSAFPEDPADFLLWLWRFDYHVDGLPVPPSGHAFVPRGVYGSYLEDTLHAARKAAAHGVDCETKAIEVVGVRRLRDRYALSFRGAAPAAYDHVALCIGNLPPALPCRAVGDLDFPRYIADPWHEPGLTEIAPNARVAIIGTGLTAVDVVLSLLDQGHKGLMIAVSRRGLIPHSHEQTRRYADFLASEPAPETTLQLFVRLRTEIRGAEAAGYDWRSVIDAFRPHTERCWRALPEAERRRFLRHVRPYWEVHRHRMAPQAAERLWGAFRRGQLLRRKGRLTAIAADGSDLVLRFRSRGGRSAHSLRAAHVVNSSGPQFDVGRLDHPLVASALRRGLARPDRLGLGLRGDAGLPAGRGGRRARTRAAGARPDRPRRLLGVDRRARVAQPVRPGGKHARRPTDERARLSNEGRRPPSGFNRGRGNPQLGARRNTPPLFRSAS